MICFPNCKINLGLYIENKRVDGFHNIKTVFYPVNLCDGLEISQADNELSMQVSGIAINGDIENNLCVKAFRVFEKEFNLPPIHIELLKTIPHGAGLGGGSSDAAFMFKLLNDFFKLNLSENQLINYASNLGSDCTFFIENKAVIASEKGNIFKNIKLSLKDLYIIIIKPPINVSTPDAYRWVNPRNKVVDIEQIIKKPITDWRHLLINDFEESLFNKYPEIEAIKKELYKYGALYASMSGSGSSVFGLFENQIPDITINNQYFIWKSKLL